MRAIPCAWSGTQICASGTLWVSVRLGPEFEHPYLLCRAGISKCLPATRPWCCKHLQAQRVITLGGGVSTRWLSGSVRVPGLHTRILNVSLGTYEFGGCGGGVMGMCIPLCIRVGPCLSVGGNNGECLGFWFSHWDPCLLDIPQSSARLFIVNQTRWPLGPSGVDVCFLGTWVEGLPPGGL